MQFNLVIHTDPAHGWGQVPHSLLKDLGITDQISTYSYLDNENAYLEEDCDLSLFMLSAKNAGLQIQITEKHTDHESPIRNKKRFK
jgi:hypothetical protein